MCDQLGLILERVRLLEKNQPQLLQLLSRFNQLELQVEELKKEIDTQTHSRLSRRSDVPARRKTTRNQVCFKKIGKDKQMSTKIESNSVTAPEPDLTDDEDMDADDADWTTCQKDGPHEPPGSLDSGKMSEPPTLGIPMDNSEDVVEVKPYLCKFCVSFPPPLFSHPSELAEHYTSQHCDIVVENPGQFKRRSDTESKLCPKCGATFTTRKFMTRHLRLIHTPPRFKCGVCGKKFRERHKVKTHALLVHLHSNMNDPEPSESEMLQAMAMITELGPTEVSLDANLDLDPDGMDQEKVKRGKPMTTARKEAALAARTCGECGKVYSTPTKMRRHVTQIHQPPAFTCEHCGEMIRWKAVLIQHLKTAHGVDTESETPKPKLDPLAAQTCPKCGKVYDTRSAMRRHLVRMHTDPGVVFKCPHDSCGRTYRRPDKLRAHQRLAHGPFSWLRSKQGLPPPSSVDEQSGPPLQPQVSFNLDLNSPPIPSTEGQKPITSANDRVECPECKKTFHKYNLVQHRVTHTAERPHICETCGFGFRRVRNLETHRLRHTGERPFSCPEANCERKFRTKNEMNRHVVALHNH